MSEEARQPTPAVHRKSPLYDFYGETLYPYINHKMGGVTPYLCAFKRAIAPINPFAFQQVPTTDSVAQGDKFGERMWAADPYPSKITRENHYTSHYDPFKNPRFSQPSGAQVISRMPVISFENFPRHCTRSVDTYRTCLIANDDNKEQCANEGNDILSICPPWALDKMKDNNTLKMKLEATANKKLSSVMQVEDYNKGKTIADIPSRTWADGERSKLRPNSMWADDRYADITQKEIDEAKQRVRKRNQAKGVKSAEVHIAAYDRNYEAPSTKIPLYP